MPRSAKLYTEKKKATKAGTIHNISLSNATAESAVPAGAGAVPEAADVVLADDAGVVIADAAALERSVTDVDDAGAREVIVLREMLDILVEAEVWDETAVITEVSDMVECEIDVLLPPPVPDAAPEVDDGMAEVDSCLFGSWPGKVILGIAIPLAEHKTTNSVQ